MARLPSKFKTVFKEFALDGGDDPPERWYEFDDNEDDRVITGVAVRLNPGDVEQLVVVYKTLDPESGKVGRRSEVETDGGDVAERMVGREIAEDTSDVVLTGLGLRANPGDTKDLWIYSKRIDENGMLVDERTDHVPIESNGEKERKVILEGQHVVVAVGVRANPGDIKSIRGKYSRIERR